MLNRNSYMSNKTMPSQKPDVDFLSALLPADVPEMTIPPLSATITCITYNCGYFMTINFELKLQIPLH